MMDKRDIAQFFDLRSSTWDENIVTDNEVTEKILSIAGIEPGCSVLDVACGTGILFPYYMSRGAAAVTGVDIAPGMIRAARGKFGDKPGITLICGDVEETAFTQSFDAVMVYNAFPHFDDGRRLIDKLASVTKTGGTLTVAHGMSREKVNARHSGYSEDISVELMPAEELAELFAGNFEDITVISDDSMYLVSGRKIGKNV